MMYRDDETKPIHDRAGALAALGTATRWWGADVPEDPGSGELAELLDEVVERLRGDQRDERLRRASEPLAEAVEALNAVARLGGLLPAVSMWHLRNAIRLEAEARSHLTEAAQRQAIKSPLAEPTGT
ncbi:hypothetical protein [Streptacidiphilus sp. EB103A]|uniref:hypothetical protein n=1 Tax=Streptacidiphilus sp. EB103A TaxID=3156275 RepID=UPI00351811B8